MNILILFVIFLIKNLRLAECIDCSVKPLNTEARLKQKLLCSYDKDVLPVLDSKNGTIVTINMILESFDYSEYSNMLHITSWLVMEWNDNHLKWDPAEYEGLKSITIHSSDIWMPDLAVYSIENSQFSETCTPAHCNVDSSGNVNCVPPCSHSGTCVGEYANWPFDIQNCTIVFGTWAFKGEELKILAKKIEIVETAIKNKEWKLVNVNFKNFPGKYECCPNETYPTTAVTFIIQRHAAGEMAFIITPALILVFINLASLWLSPTCTERILLNVLEIISHFLFIQQLTWLVPKNGENSPKALTFFRDSLIMSTILILQTVILRGLLASTTAVPSWIISTTDSLRGNRIGQLMFTNPYLLNRGGNIIVEDSSNLVEEQPTLESNHQPKTDNKSNIWLTTVRVLDSLMFLSILLSYIILLFGWLPNSSDVEGNVKSPNTIILPDKV